MANKDRLHLKEKKKAVDTPPVAGHNVKDDAKVAGGKAVQRHTAHQYIVGGTQAAAEGPIQCLPCLCGKVAQVRALRGENVKEY